MINPAFAYAKAKALITAPLFSPCMLDLVGNTIDRVSHEVSHIFFKYLIISFNSEISSSFNFLRSLHVKHFLLYCNHFNKVLKFQNDSILHT